MPFLSSLLRKHVTDAEGTRLGRVIDAIATAQGELPHPQLVGLVVSNSGGPRVVPIADVAVLVGEAIPLHRAEHEITDYVVKEQDLYLVRDVLDKQIIDIDGIRVVRVNDLELTRVSGHFYVANVEIGTLGLLRRLGWEKLFRRIAALFHRQLAPTAISWDHVEFLPGDRAVRLRVPGARIAELHPADLAEILSDLGRQESTRLLESLDVDTLAGTLEEVEPEFQASLIERMPDEKVADVLEAMSPDEAADLLAELPEERSTEILRLMEKPDAEEVRLLLSYDEDSAGGIMTTEFISVAPGLTAEQALAELRRSANEAETIYYIYVLDEHECLQGVFSLRDLVLAQPETPVAEFMHERVVTAQADTPQDEVAQAVSKYNLLAVPVVDAEGRMLGIVTADDALDRIIPTAWKKRLPRMHH